MGVVLLGAAVLGAVGCGRERAPTNVLLVTLDTLRADHVGYVGGAKAATPNLDALAARGVAFRDVQALVPITLPSHASILFGIPPHELQHYNNGQILPPLKGAVPAAELFKARGYATAAFVSLGVLEKRYGLARGFDIYEDAFPKDRWYLDAAEVNARALPWLERVRGGKFFGWIHYSDPHDPYAPPDTPDDTVLKLNGEMVGRLCLAKYPTAEVDLDLRAGENTLVWTIRNDSPESAQAYLARFDRLEFSPAPDAGFRTTFGPEWEIRAADGVYFAKDNAGISIRSDARRRVRLSVRGRPIWSLEYIRKMYRREVEYLDRELGRLWAKLTELGLWDTTAVVVAGDHGEGLGEFDNAFGEAHVGHIHYLYSYYVRVPLIVVDPRAERRGILRDDPATLLDIAPTLAALAGFESPRQFQGRNLLGRSAPATRDILTATYKPEAIYDKFALRRSPWHLILTPQENKIEVYDLRTDPEEIRNLFGGTEMPEDARPLLPLLETRTREILMGKTEVKIDKGAEDMLRALGYIK